MSSPYASVYPSITWGDHTCLPAGWQMLSLRLQMGDIENVSSNNLYVTSWKHSFKCTHQKKMVFGESGRAGHPCDIAVLLSFPSHCSNATEGKTWQGEFNSELKCRRQGKEADVAAQLICNSQTYLGWWIMSCQDYMWQQNGLFWSGIIELIMGKFLYLRPANK